MRKLVRLLCFIAILFLYNFKCAAQADSTWPPKIWTVTWNDSTFTGPAKAHHILSQNLKGYVILKTGDTLQGYMNLIHNECFFLQKGHFKPVVIKPRRIGQIHVDISSLGQPTTELYTFNIMPMRHAFWRLIKSEGNVTLYDKSEGVFSDLPPARLMESSLSKSHFNEFLFMMSDNKPTKVYRRFSPFSGEFVVKSTAKRKMLKFINRRYGQHFKADDFTSEMQMADYMLARESKRSQSVSADVSTSHLLK